MTKNSVAENRELIFVSYALPDRDRVTPFFNQLTSKGYDAWMDSARLKAGQRWDFEIQRALKRAALIIVFISNNSIDRRGYVQREIKIALDQATEKLAGDIYIVPILLDPEAVIPEQLKDIHFIRSDDRDCFEKLEDSIRHQLEQLGKSASETQTRSSVTWSASTYRDVWDGLPGYEVEFKLLHFSSSAFPSIVEVTDIIRGELLAEVAEQRAIKLVQDPTHYNFGQERFSRTNTWDAFPSEPKIVGKVLSIQYSVSWYWSGSAHPHMGFRSHCFLLDPLLRIGELQSLFEYEKAALSALQDGVRTQLLSTDDPERSLKDQEEKVLAGTGNWDCFRSFVFEEDGLLLSFPPYAVAAYASGPQFAKVPTERFSNLLRPWFRSALGIW